MTVPLHILGWLCGWNFSRWDAECHVLREPAFSGRCSGLPCLGADAGVYTVGALGKEKQVEQLTAGGPKMGLRLPAWAEFPWHL